MPAWLASLLQAVRPQITIVSSAPPEPAQPPVPPSLTLWRDSARKELDLQFHTMEFLDTRSGTTLSVGSTVLPLSFGLLALRVNGEPPKVTIICLGLALLAYGVLLLASWLASRIRALENRPNMRTLRGLYESGFDPIAVEEWVAREHLASIQENRRPLRQKGRRVGLATTALYVEGALLAVAGFATLL